MLLAGAGSGLTAVPLKSSENLRHSWVTAVIAQVLRVTSVLAPSLGCSSGVADQGAAAGPWSISRSRVALLWYVGKGEVYMREPEPGKAPGVVVRSAR